MCDWGVRVKWLYISRKLDCCVGSGLCGLVYGITWTNVGLFKLLCMVPNISNHWVETNYQTIFFRLKQIIISSWNI